MSVPYFILFASLKRKELYEKGIREKLDLDTYECMHMYTKVCVYFYVHTYRVGIYFVKWEYKSIQEENSVSGKSP